MRSVVVLILVMAQVTTAWACDCMPSTRDQVMAGAAAVFTGQVESVTQEGRMHAVSLHVTEIAKGTIGEKVTVYTAAQGATCGVTMQPGQTVELAVRDRHGRWSAGLCDQMGLQH